MIPKHLKMWSYDIAREQSPSLDNLKYLCKMSLESGYNAIGLYLEHRFQYPSLPIEPGSKYLGPQDIKTLEQEFPELLIIPMVNVLAHIEGFLRTEGYQELSEVRFSGLQACPSNLHTKKLARQIIQSTMESFSSPLIHIGGDETASLGVCPACKTKVEDWEQTPGVDGKAKLYAEFYEPLIQMVLEGGRTPAIWGDMLLAHPQAQKSISKETIVFDWHYFHGPKESATELKSSGFKVIACPTLHTYNAGWIHMKESQQNLTDHLNAMQELNLDGICFTTWEADLFGMFETWIPAISSAGRVISEGTGTLLEEYQNANASEWAKLMSTALAESSPSFQFGSIRSGVKCRFLLYSNPFLLWLRHPDLCGEPANTAKSILEKAIAIAPNSAYRGVSEWISGAIRFCEHAQLAAQFYRGHELGLCQRELNGARQIFESLERIAAGACARFGGSKADIWRCRTARDHVEKVMARVRDFGDGSLGYMPSFEHLCHPKFVPYDEGAWWLVNSWANEYAIPDLSKGKSNQPQW